LALRNISTGDTKKNIPERKKSKNVMGQAERVLEEGVSIILAEACGKNM